MLREGLPNSRAAEERDIVIKSRPLEAMAFQVENIRVAFVFYESGLSINVMCDVDDPKRRAVGFKLSEGMDVPEELAKQFKFATQKSKLVGRGLAPVATKIGPRGIATPKQRFKLAQAVVTKPWLRVTRKVKSTDREAGVRGAGDREGRVGC